jgi:PAS domain S-box-containing protein
MLVPGQESTGGDLTALVQDIVNHPERYANNINENLLRDGSRVWMAWTNRPIFDQDGQVLEILAVGSDITERKRAEEEVRRQREWLRVTLTSIGDAVIATDASGLITFINPVAQALTGWRLEAAVGLPVQQVFRMINEKTREPAEDIAARVLREGCTVALANHTALVARDGREIPIEDSAAPIKDDAGKVSGAVLVFHDVTARRRAQEDLRESETRLRLAIESAELGTWDFDPLTGALNWSDRCKAVFGLPADAHVDYQVFLDRLHPDDRQDTHEIVQAALDPTGEGRFAAEYRALWPEGTERWIIAAGRTFFDAVSGERRAVRFIGTVLDVTQRRQAEEQIRAQNAILETINRIFHNALTCETEEQLGAICLEAAEELTRSKFGFIGEFDPDGSLYDISISNPGWEACTMVDQSGHRRPPLNFPVHGLYGRVLLDGKALLTNDPESHPDSIGTPSGHPPLTAFLGVPLIHHGKTQGMVGLANREGGYTQEQLLAVEAIAPAMVEALMRKRAEAIVSQSQARFKLLSETSSRLLASQTPQAIVQELCLQVMQHLDCQAFFNFMVDELMGKLHLNAYSGIPEEEARAIEWLDFGVAVCGCAARDGKRIVAEDIFHTADVRTELVKSYGIQAYACHPLEVQGKIIGTLSFGTKTRTHFSAEDLALMKTVADQVATAMEKLRLIDDLRSSRDELELRVQERTAQLERSNQALQDFTSIAAHDLQEPLRKIGSFGNMIKQKHGDRLGENGKDYLDRMLGASSRMQSLLASLLDYSRVTTKAELPRKVNLTEIVREVLADLEIRITQSGAKIQVEDLPAIEADPTQMRQLFQNLLGNALKFHKKGEQPMIRVRCSSAGKREMQITVEDNGIGFEEKFVDRIFAPFERLHGRHEYQGAGMGLAICKKIVERHAGSITATSSSGKGSSFIITLPLKQPTGLQN